MVKCNRISLGPVVRVCKNSNGAFYKSLEPGPTEKLILSLLVLSDEGKRKELPLKVDITENDGSEKMYVRVAQKVLYALRDGEPLVALEQPFSPTACLTV